MPEAAPATSGFSCRFLLRLLVQLRDFERFHVLQAIHDASAYFQEVRPLPAPTPAFERARAQTPTSRQLHLVEVTEVWWIRESSGERCGDLRVQRRFSA